MSQVFVPNRGELFKLKLGYFNIFHSLEIDEVETSFDEQMIYGICLEMGIQPRRLRHGYAQVLRFYDITSGSLGKLRTIELDFYDKVEFFKIGDKNT